MGNSHPKANVINISPRKAAALKRHEMPVTGSPSKKPQLTTTDPLKFHFTIDTKIRLEKVSFGLMHKGNMHIRWMDIVAGKNINDSIFECTVQRSEVTVDGQMRLNLTPVGDEVQRFVIAWNKECERWDCNFVLEPRGFQCNTSLLDVSEGKVIEEECEKKACETEECDRKEMDDLCKLNVKDRLFTVTAIGPIVTTVEDTRTKTLSTVREIFIRVGDC